MNIKDSSSLMHEHVFDTGSTVAEKRSKIVMWITAVMMVVEILAGWRYNSMALLADGWHMSSHAVAIGLSAFAYVAARRYAKDFRFAFGTWKIEVLAGYTSAIFLLGVAVMMVEGSLVRLFSPTPIRYEEAMFIAGIGLVVNLVCAFVLRGAHSHDHHKEHGHEHQHDHHEEHGHTHGQDLNLKAAYFHVLADAATSVLAIIALAGGLAWGWAWLDPVMGLAGAALVGIWAWKLIGETGKVLLDREMDHPLVEEIRSAVERCGKGTKVCDLHVWRVGKSSYSCAMSLTTEDKSLTCVQVRDCLQSYKEISHATVEVMYK